MTSELQKRWNGDVAGLPGSAAAKAAAFDEIIVSYSQPHRRYHAVGHLEALFALLDQHAQSVTEPLPLHFALWWHDVVYEPQASDNEERSAALARMRLTELGADHHLIETVDKLILATRNHWDGPTLGDGDYFLDADIAILGAPAATYDRYGDSIRQEYAFAPEPAYRAGRSKFLSAAAARPRLFRTDSFEVAYGEVARQNMLRELTRLS